MSTKQAVVYKSQSVKMLSNFELKWSYLKVKKSEIEKQIFGTRREFQLFV